MIWRIILDNLREASSELAELRSRMGAAMNAGRHQPSQNRFNELVFFVSLEHAYHHVNWAWNCRHKSEQRAIRCSEADYRAWEKFPIEFKELWLAPSRCRGKARGLANGTLHLKLSKIALDKAVVTIDGLCCGIFRLLDTEIPKGFLDRRDPSAVMSINESEFEAQICHLYVCKNKAWNVRKMTGASMANAHRHSCYPRAFSRFWPAD